KPLPWNRDALDKASDGKPVRIVGYGIDKPQTDPTAKHGLKKDFTTQIDRVTPGLVWIPAGKSGPCHGDSGGPMLLKKNGVETVVGVAHVTLKESCRDGANYERLDVYADFIQRYVDLAGASPQTPPPDSKPQDQRARASCSRTEPRGSDIDLLDLIRVGTQKP